MSTIIPLPGGGYRLLTKGASEIVLNKCTTIMAENGHIAPLTSEDKKYIVSTVVQSMASNALRTIGLAYRSVVVGHRGVYCIVNDSLIIAETSPLHRSLMKSPWKQTGKMKRTLLVISLVSELLVSKIQSDRR